MLTMITTAADQVAEVRKDLVITDNESVAAAAEKVLTNPTPMSDEPIMPLQELGWRVSVTM